MTLPCHSFILVSFILVASPCSGIGDNFKINEAFAPQTIACQRALDLDPAILNMNGGAIALGHPLGASGSRITAHIVHEIRRRGIKYGIGSACIGGGQGIALLLESL